MKMRDLIFIGCYGLALTPMNIQAASYGMSGCGLGSYVVKDKPGIIQIVGATTNDLVISQTYPITSGTSNCLDEDPRQEASLFIAINKESLQTDISKGQGDSLTGLLKIYQCDQSDHLSSSLQKSYITIFPSIDSTAVEVNQAIENLIRADQELSGACKLFS